jgi:hypothetical protein
MEPMVSSIDLEYGFTNPACTVSSNRQARRWRLVVLQLAQSSIRGLGLGGASHPRGGADEMSRGATAW